MPSQKRRIAVRVAYSLLILASVRSSVPTRTVCCKDPRSLGMPTSYDPPKGAPRVARTVNEAGRRTPGEIPPKWSGGRDHLDGWRIHPATVVGFTPAPAVL